MHSCTYWCNPFAWWYTGLDDKPWFKNLCSVSSVSFYRSIWFSSSIVYWSSSISLMRAFNYAFSFFINFHSSNVGIRSTSSVRCMLSPDVRMPNFDSVGLPGTCNWGWVVCAVFVTIFKSWARLAEEKDIALGEDNPMTLFWYTEDGVLCIPKFAL